MDDVARTTDTYESEASSYIEKYWTESVAANYGERFFDSLEPGTADRPIEVLDIGCGPGVDVDVFAEMGYDITGVDVTSSFLREGSERVPEAAFVRGDMRHLPFENAAFDGIWASASFHHVPSTDAGKTLREYRRVLRPGGNLFISTKRDEEVDDDDTERHFEYYQPAEFRDMLKEAGLRIASMQTTELWVAAVATCPDG
jgi:ubiquinone/menaquinone biosynthesis C-methylase UbiE